MTKTPDGGSGGGKAAAAAAAAMLGEGTIHPEIQGMAPHHPVSVCEPSDVEESDGRLLV